MYTRMYMYVIGTEERMDATSFASKTNRAVQFRQLYLAPLGAESRSLASRAARDCSKVCAKIEVTHVYASMLNAICVRYPMSHLFFLSIYLSS